MLQPASVPAIRAFLADPVAKLHRITSGLVSMVKGKSGCIPKFNASAAQTRPMSPAS